MIPRTARVLASRRALELKKSFPLIKDPYAKLFTDQESMEFARQSDQSIHYVMMRHRFFDDLLALNRKDFKQIVILGSGFDSKSIRYQDDQSSFWEIDQPAVIEHKKQALKDHGYDVVNTCCQTLKGRDDLVKALTRINPELSTLVIAEGFWMYLTSQDALECIAYLLEYFGKNLVMGFDTLSKTYLKDEKNLQALQRLKNKGGEVAKFFYKPEEFEMFFNKQHVKFSFWTPEQLQNKYYGSQWEHNNDKYVSIVTDPSINYRI